MGFERYIFFFLQFKNSEDFFRLLGGNLVGDFFGGGEVGVIFCLCGGFFCVLFSLSFFFFPPPL